MQSFKTKKTYSGLLLIFMFISIPEITFSQRKLEIKNCIMQLIDIPEIHSYIFSLTRNEGDSILCIQSKDYIVGDTLISFETEDFSDYKKHSIYVKAPSFIIGYDVNYWMSIDSVDYKKDFLIIDFKMTNYYHKDPNYTYLIGKVYFVKLDNIWQIHKKVFDIGKYHPPFKVDSDYVQRVRERNRALIQRLDSLDRRE